MADDTQTARRETRADYPVGTRVLLGLRTWAARRGATVVEPTRTELPNAEWIRVRHDETGIEQTWQLNLDDIEPVASDADGAQYPDDDIRAWPIGMLVEIDDRVEADVENWRPARITGHEVPGVVNVLVEDEPGARPWPWELGGNDLRRRRAPAPAAAPPSRKIELPPTLTSCHDEINLSVLLVGCGGTGAWIAPMLPKLVRHGSVSFIDDDVVEHRNLERQNFSVRDVGRAKAVVLANRYGRALEERGCEVETFVKRLDTAWLQQYLITHPNAIILGCVDNRATRRAIHEAVTTSYRVLWIDCGNELRGGQVLLSLYAWTFTAKGAGFPADAWSWTQDTINDVLPELLDPEQANGGVTCDGRDRDTGRIVLNLQSVGANHTAASIATNMLAWIVNRVPFSQTGVFFSTFNTTETISLGRMTSNPARTGTVGQFRATRGTAVVAA